ncbi:MAG: TfoX/Sxy family protein [Methyloceanibacter sp.]|nr:TfoX/Sxy family protein [Methyloceanibacter sp.]
MSASDGFQEFLKDQLSGFGPIAIRRMFGGAGVYADNVMFALIADDTLYLKADDTNIPAFEAEGMQPFTYTAKGRKPISMSYWEVPPRLLEEPGELAEWARVAHRVACATKKPARKKTPSNKKPSRKRKQ